MKKVIYVLIIMFLAAGMFGCGKRAEKKEAAINVLVKKVTKTKIARALEYVGSIKGVDEALVYPKVSGKIIEKVREEGAPVAKGDPILFIDRDEVGFKFEKAPVESPITGVVGRIYVDIGANVTPQTAVAMVSNMDQVQIDLMVPEQYLHEIALGKRAIISIDAYADLTFEGVVTEMSPVVDIETRASPVEITIEDKEKLLRSGMFAKVKLIMSEKNDVPVIPREAIIGKAPDQFIYVVEGDIARMRKVTLGIREGQHYEITDGLNEGDLVVIMGQQRLRDGTPVSAEIDAEPAKTE